MINYKVSSARASWSIILPSLVVSNPVKLEAITNDTYY